MFVNALYRFDVLIIIDALDHDCSLYAREIKDIIVMLGGTAVSVSTVRYWCRRIGYTYKKVWKYARRARMEQELGYWHHFALSNYHVNQLVFFDESSVNKRNANRRYGRAMKGERAVFRTIFSRGLKRYSLLAAVDMNGVIDYGVIEGTCTAHTLFMYFVQSLIPVMQPYPNPRSVLILDNARIHHYLPFQILCKYAGIRLIYLPPYSPHLNMIELLFNALKRSLEANAAMVAEFPVLTLIALCEKYRRYDVLGAMRNAGYLRYCRTA